MVIVIKKNAGNLQYLFAKQLTKKPKKHHETEITFDNSFHMFCLHFFWPRSGRKYHRRTDQNRARQSTQRIE
jgi:hypothetical protein